MGQLLDDLHNNMLCAESLRSLRLFGTEFHAECARVLDMKIHDHLIIGDGSRRSVSFLERGLL